jgi:hypothetical protein
MTRNSARRSGAALLLRALMVGVALPAVVVVTPASAFQIGSESPSVVIGRMTGWWATSDGTYYITRQGDTLALSMTDATRKRRYNGFLQLARDGKSFEGDWREEAYGGQRPTAGRMSLRTNPDGTAFSVAALKGDEPPISGYATRTPAPDTSTAQIYARWLGDWTTSEGTLTVAVEGDHVLGTIWKDNGAGKRTVSRTLVFGKVENRTKLVGAWAAPDWLGDAKGGAAFLLSPDGTSGTLQIAHPVNPSSMVTRRPGYTPAPRTGQMEGVWAVSTDNFELTQNETFVRITEGQTISAETWQVTAEGAKKIDDTLLSRVAPDRLAGNGLEIIAPPGKNYRLMVRQTSRGFKWPVYLRPVDAIGAPYDAPTPEAIREGFTGDWGTPSGILRIVRKFDRLEGTYQGRTAYTSPMTLVGEQVSWNTGGDSENNVDIILSPDAQELQFIRRNAISGVRNWTATKVAPGRPPSNEPHWVQSLSPFAGEWILTDRVGAPMGKMKLAMGETALSGRGVQPDGREGERFEFLFKHNADFDYASGTWAFAGHGGRAELRMNPDGQSLTGTTSNGTSRRPSPLSGPQRRLRLPLRERRRSRPRSPHPRRARLPRPRPRPGLSPFRSCSPRLLRWCSPPRRRVRSAPSPNPACSTRWTTSTSAGPIVPARDGAVNVFVTVKNKAGKEKYISTAAFLIVQLTDSDGVSVRQGTMLRATAEGSESLPAGMTLPADGELKGRFTIIPPEVHGPLRTVSIRQSDKKAVWFDASGADADPSPFAAPAAGRGAFKPLSKFDLRIDNIAPARDGTLEAFITLRNPGRDCATCRKAPSSSAGRTPTVRSAAPVASTTRFAANGGTTGCPRVCGWSRALKPGCAWSGSARSAARSRCPTARSSRSSPPAADPHSRPAPAGRAPLSSTSKAEQMVDGDTASASEQFVAQLQAARAAVVAGSPTHGSGCGYITGSHGKAGAETVLKNSGGRLFMPNCARFLPDGRNEVGGLEPDVLLPFRPNDTPHQKAARLSAALPRVLAAATASARAE